MQRDSNHDPNQDLSQNVCSPDPETRNPEVLVKRGQSQGGPPLRAAFVTCAEGSTVDVMYHRLGLWEVAQ